MPKKKPPLRIRTEKSQKPWNSTPKQDKENEYTRGLKNRISQLEAKIATLSTGNNGEELRIRTTEQVIALLESYSKSGFWGDTVEETAEQILRASLRTEELMMGSGYR